MQGACQLENGAIRTAIARNRRTGIRIGDFQPIFSEAAFATALTPAPRAPADRRYDAVSLASRYPDRHQVRRCPNARRLCAKVREKRLVRSRVAAAAG
jgi:hypothetical protein